MDKTKFTVRVDREALEAAKMYASRYGVTLTSLVEEFLRSLGKADQIRSDTPILDALTGSLRPDVTLDEYRTYLEKKYLDS